MIFFFLTLYLKSALVIGYSSFKRIADQSDSCNSILYDFLVSENPNASNIYD